MRGRTPPTEDTLRRLHDLNTAYRVSWTPATGRRPARWWLHEERLVTEADYWRARAAENRLARLAKIPVEMLEDRRAEVWQAEEIRLGWYYVGDYSEQEFGSDRMLTELAHGEQLYRQALKRQAVEAQREREAKDEVSEEMDTDPTFRQRIRDVAYDFYGAVAGHTSVGWTPALAQGNGVL